MLRQDGKIKAYKIYAKGKSGDFYDVSDSVCPLRSTGYGRDGNVSTKHAERDTGENRGKLKGPIAEALTQFSSCGDCWHKYGIHATESLAAAMLVFSSVIECNPGIAFELREIYLEQTTRTLMSGQM